MAVYQSSPSHLTRNTGRQLSSLSVCWLNSPFPLTRCSALMQETGFNNGQYSFDCLNYIITSSSPNWLRCRRWCLSTRSEGTEVRIQESTGSLDRFYLTQTSKSRRLPP